MPDALRPVPVLAKPEKCQHGTYTPVVTDLAGFRFANANLQVVRVVMCNGCASFFAVGDVPYDVASGR